MMNPPESNPVVEDLEKALQDATSAADTSAGPQEPPTALEAPVGNLDPLEGIQQPTNNEVANALQAVQDAGG